MKVRIGCKNDSDVNGLKVDLRVQSGSFLFSDSSDSSVVFCRRFLTSFTYSLFAFFGPIGFFEGGDFFPFFFSCASLFETRLGEAGGFFFREVSGDVLLSLD